jgi:hypothetical protein
LDLGSWHRRVALLSSGAVAQLVEHRLCKPGVRGSSPLCSTIFFWCGDWDGEIGFFRFLFKAVFGFLKRLFFDRVDWSVREEHRVFCDLKAKCFVVDAHHQYEVIAVPAFD